MNVEAYIQQIKHLPARQQEEFLQMITKLSEMHTRATAQQDFMSFVREIYPGFIEGNHHRIIANAFERVSRGELKRLIVNMPPRHRLALDTPIATTSGWKTVASVQAGDYVFDPSGKPVLVTGKSPIAFERLYRASTNDGAWVECDGDHLWTVRFGSHGKFVTLSTREVMDKTLEESWARHNNFPMLPRQRPVEYPARDLSVDPYVLGAWLGDGSSASGCMAAHPNDAPHIRARFEAAGVKTTTLSWNMTFGTRGLMVLLRRLGVLNDKHIPEVYLTASVAQRLALLQGLMDTDGSVSMTGKCEFHASNKHLALQALQLVRSLGAKAGITVRHGRYRGKLGKLAYRVAFKLAGAASLPRKAERTRAILGNFSRSLHIEETDRFGEVQCLSVASADGLFLAGEGYIPTHNTKSEFASYLFPAWFLGQFPGKKVIQASHTADLAVSFGRKVRNLVGSAEYHQIFPGVDLRADSKAAGRWNTNKNGEYVAMGVGGAMAGKGADLMIIDDPHSESDAILGAHNPQVWDDTYQWYTSGPRQRLQPGGAIIIVATRWAKKDLTGRIIEESMKNPKADEWEVIELPAILPEERDPETKAVLKPERPIWPEFWSLAELQSTRSEIPVSKWQAQYQQQPTSEEGAIVKRDWWRPWQRQTPPECEYVIQSWDTAFTKNESSDPCACTTWGVFHLDSEDGKNKIAHVILLDAIQRRMEFPELKKSAQWLYHQFQPDSLIVEAKSSGLPLVFELRQLGIPVTEYTPSRGADKIARVNAVSDLFRSGNVWYPEGMSWADEVREQFATFPLGEADDLVDSATMALIRFRQGGFIQLESDEQSSEPLKIRRRRAEYY